MDAIEQAPHGSHVHIKEPTRTTDQNARMWAMLHDIAEQGPLGRKHTPDDWKCIMMRACGWEVKFRPGRSGEFFPVGYRTSHLGVRQMAELITFMLGWGAEVGIVWSEPHPDERQRG
jgi:hypothetical protein